jgi:hypothetical protein
MLKQNPILIMAILSLSLLQSCKEDTFSEFQTIDSRTSVFYKAIPGCYFDSKSTNGNNYRLKILSNGIFQFILTDAEFPCECINGEWKLKDSILILKSNQIKKFSCHGQNEDELGVWQNQESFKISLMISNVTDTTVEIKGKRKKNYSYKKSTNLIDELFENCN